MPVIAGRCPDDKPSWPEWRRAATTAAVAASAVARRATATAGSIPPEPPDARARTSPEPGPAKPPAATSTAPPSSRHEPGHERHACRRTAGTATRSASGTGIPAPAAATRRPATACPSPGTTSHAGASAGRMGWRQGEAGASWRNPRGRGGYGKTEETERTKKTGYSEPGTLVTGPKGCGLPRAIEPFLTGHFRSLWSLRSRLGLALKISFWRPGWREYGRPRRRGWARA